MDVIVINKHAQLMSSVPFHVIMHVGLRIFVLHDYYIYWTAENLPFVRFFFFGIIFAFLNLKHS